MTASFNALKSIKEKLAIIIVLFSLTPWILPVVGKAHAETGQQKGLNFEIKSESISQITENKNSQLIAFETIDRKVKLVREYLESKGSPFALYTEILLAQEDWKTILAISNSESTLGKRCYMNNCSGIFGKKGLRTYASIPAWMVDMQGLLDRRYEGWSLNRMNGVYVVPRSNNWYLASSKVLNDLTQIENQVNAEVAELSSPTNAS